MQAGMAKGSGAQKSKTPLAQQKIDPVSMPLKTIIKVACAKDKFKSAAVKAAKVILHYDFAQSVQLHHVVLPAV